MLKSNWLERDFYANTYFKILGFSGRDLKWHIQNGYITERVHPENPNLAIYNYTEKTTYERNWNEVTINCRGLIIDKKTSFIRALPFKKFFNYGEMLEYDEQIPDGEIPEVYTKYDGSLGISYWLGDGVRWATRGSFTSEQSRVAQEIWDAKYKDKEKYVNPFTTLLVEIIDPRTRVVVDYKGESDLVLLGARDLITGKEYTYDELRYFGSYMGMKVAERMMLTIDRVKELKSELSVNEEGFVVRWPSNGLRLKIKGDQYLAAHRILYGLSDKMKVQYWADGKMDDLIQQMPEEFRKEIEEIKNQLDEIFEFTIREIKLIYSKIDSGLGRKEFAEEVKYFTDLVRPNLFRLYDGKPIEDEVKKYMVKNYQDYVGVKECDFS